MTETEVIGANIRAIRKAKKLTQAQLAERIGVTASTVTQYEKGMIRPEIEKIPAIANALGVPEQDLFDPGKREKIALEEFLNHPQKYRQHIKDRYDELPQEIKEIVENLLYLGQKEIELYHAEIKAKALRKKEIEKDVKVEE